MSDPQLLPLQPRGRRSSTAPHRMTLAIIIVVIIMGALVASSLVIVEPTEMAGKRRLGRSWSTSRFRGKAQDCRCRPSGRDPQRAGKRRSDPSRRGVSGQRAAAERRSAAHQCLGCRTRQSRSVERYLASDLARWNRGHAASRAPAAGQCGRRQMTTAHSRLFTNDGLLADRAALTRPKSARAPTPARRSGALCGRGRRPRSSPRFRRSPAWRYPA
jgi:hypothetical protein